jgi:hypothetical protein
LSAVALAGVAGVVAVAHSDRAERIAQSVPDEHLKAMTLARVAAAVAATDPDRAARLTADAERIAYLVSDDELKAWALVRVAAVVAATDPDHAARLTEDAERSAESITIGYRKTAALADIASAVAGTDPDRAERIAHSIPDERRKALVLTEVAEAVAGTDPGGGERIAQSIASEHLKAVALARVAQAVAGIDVDCAERIAQSIPDPYQKASALARVGEAAAAIGPRPRRVEPKRRAKSRRPARWTAAEVLEALTAAGHEAADVGAAVHSWAAAHPRIRVTGGTGTTDRSFTMAADTGRGTSPYLGVLGLYATPRNGHPFLEIRIRSMLATPPYDHSPAREQLTADLQALGIPRLNEANALTSERPNIPLGELTGGRITGLLSVVDRWIENVPAYAPP